jgi:hypothetical protein
VRCIYHALRALHNLKLILAAGGGTPRVIDAAHLIELLPTLEAVVPANEVSTIAEKLQEYDRKRERAGGWGYRILVVWGLDLLLVSGEYQKLCVT